ncbi:replication initiation protein [Massilia sp. CMS3.1]|uniref:replication initiation protein n=1 Tax=Massilia sp. CMS3.1 TaxID=3373083 RepID=UPI003EE5094F
MAEAPIDLGFRRNNALVKIVDLSLAGRRLIDVTYFLAAEDTELHKEYRVDLGLFRWLLGTTSRNSRHLQQIIREAQKGAIELNEIDLENQANDWYGSVPLLGPAFVRNGEFLFELSDRLQAAIKNPATSHYLSLRFVFKSIHSKLLYDRLQEYIEEGMTPWLEISELRDWLESNKKTYDLFKHFRNKVLESAIAEIKEVAKLEIEMLTQNVPGSKRIGQVRFKVSQVKTTVQDEQKVEFLVLRSQYDILSREFALNQAEFNEIISNRETFNDERIQQAIDYTRHNVDLGKVKHRAGGYLMKALREGYRLGTLDVKIHQQLTDANKTTEAKAKAVKKTAESVKKAAADDAARRDNEALLGLEAYDLFPPSEQAEAVNDFCRSVVAKPLARMLAVTPAELREHMSDARVRSSFGMFIVGKIQNASRAQKQVPSQA